MPEPAGKTPRLLALDTATEHMALAVCGAGGVHTHAGPGGAEASSRLLPAVGALLEGAQMTLAEVQAVAFGRGPGAFTGLRVACAVAQGLSFGLGRPVLPLDSLLIVAEDAAAALDRCDGEPADVGVAMDARMGEVYAARYRRVQGVWQALAAPALCAPHEVVRHWAGLPAVVAGSGLGLLGEPALATATHRVSAEHDRPAALMRVALQAFARGDAVPPEQALPLYLRDRVALTTAERERRAAAPS